MCVCGVSWETKRSWCFDVVIFILWFACSSTGWFYLFLFIKFLIFLRSFFIGLTEGREHSC